VASTQLNTSFTLSLTCPPSQIVVGHNSIPKSKCSVTTPPDSDSLLLILMMFFASFDDAFYCLHHFSQHLLYLTSSWQHDTFQTRQTQLSCLGDFIFCALPSLDSMRQCSFSLFSFNPCQLVGKFFRLPLICPNERDHQINPSKF